MQSTYKLYNKSDLMMKKIKIQWNHKRGCDENKRSEGGAEGEERRYEVMSVEKRAGLWLVVRPETEFCHCNLTLCFCNDSPGGTNDFLHWCCYCWSHRKFKRKAFFGEGGGCVWARRLFTSRSVCPAGLTVVVVQLRSMCHSFPSPDLFF